MKQNPQISTIINSGLGNQMFQYAAGRRLAWASGGELLLMPDFGHFPGTHAVYGLREFNIIGREVAVEMPLPPMSGSRKERLVAALPGSKRRRDARTVMRERIVFEFMEASTAGTVGETDQLIFVPELLTRRRDTKLYGYWQNEAYFNDISDIIKNDFTLRNKMDAASLDCLARIQSRPSVFLHVRRGDYLETLHQIRFGTCEPEYYHGAVRLLRQMHGDDLGIFVFGNDPDWIRENKIGGEDAVLVDWNHGAPERDLMLMRACQHAVIANSSFSWWGAWLGEWQGQTVIAPKIWFKAVPEYQDIVPRRWMRLWPDGTRA